MRKILLSLAAIVACVGVASGYMYLNREVDYRLYPKNELTGEVYKDKPLVFLYSVDAATGKVLVESTVMGVVRSQLEEGKTLVEHECDAAKTLTLTGNPGACNRIELSDGMLPEENFLRWTDIASKYQQAFFPKGSVVYVTEQPLRVQDGRLIGLPGIVN